MENSTSTVIVAGLGVTALVSVALFSVINTPDALQNEVIQVRHFGQGTITRHEKAEPGSGKPEVYQIRFSDGVERHFTSDSEALK